MANMTGVELRGFEVSGYDGPFVTVDGVSGTGLDGAKEPVGREMLWNGQNLDDWKLYLVYAVAEASSASSVADGVLKLNSESAATCGR
jgi:hypothetical protein